MNRYFIPLLIIFVSFYGWSQDVDTIYVQEAPLVIRKQITVEEPSEVLTKPKTWFLVLGLGYGSYTSTQIADSIHKTIQPFVLPYLQIGKKIYGNWNISMGLGVSTASIKAQYTEKYTKTVEVQKERYDTVGQYTVQLPTGEETHYTIDSTPYIDYEKHRYDSTLYLNSKIAYWSIPLQIAYQFTYHKIYAEPYMALIYNIGSKSQVFVSDKNISIPKTFFSGSLGVNLGYQLTSRFSVEAGGFYNQQLTQTSNYLKVSTKSLKLQLKYLF